MKNRSQSELGPSALMLNIEIEPMAMIADSTSHSADRPAPPERSRVTTMVAHTHKAPIA
jgi:hypothetical protein